MFESVTYKDVRLSIFLGHLSIFLGESTKALPVSPTTSLGGVLGVQYTPQLLLEGLEGQ